MSDLTRMETFLRAAIDGKSSPLKPLTRVEKLLSELVEKLGGSAPTVILEETELQRYEVEGGYSIYAITTAPLATPEADKTYTVTYNGTPYDSAAVLDDEGNWDFPINDAGGFAMLLASGGEEIVPGVMAYGFVVPEDGSTPLSLSIVEKAEAESGGGGVFIVNATVTEMSGDGLSGTLSVDKTYEETVKAFKDGWYVACQLPMNETTMRLPAVQVDDGTAITFVVQTKYVLMMVLLMDNSSASLTIELMAET